MDFEAIVDAIFLTKTAICCLNSFASVLNIFSVAYGETDQRQDEMILMHL